MTSLPHVLKMTSYCLREAGCCDCHFREDHSLAHTGRVWVDSSDRAYWRLTPKAGKSGGASGRLASFVDHAPTMISIARIKPPEYMQGHAFLGEFQAPAPHYLYGLRARTD